MNTNEHFGDPVNKRIENIYDFDNYKLILSTDYFLRHSENPKYSLRSYSRDLDVSHGYLSEVMSGKREFSVSKGVNAFEKIGFRDEEIEYIESLITLKTSEDSMKLSDANYIFKNKYNSRKFKVDNNQDRIMDSPEHFIVFSLLHEYESVEQMKKVTSLFKISEDELINILNYFIEVKYIKKENESYKIINPNHLITSHDRYCEFLFNLSTFFLEHYKETNINRIPDYVASAFILPLDENTAKEINEHNKHYINSLFKIADRTKVADRFAFITNLYLEKDIQLN